MKRNLSWLPQYQRKPLITVISDVQSKQWSSPEKGKLIEQYQWLDNYGAPSEWTMSWGKQVCRVTVLKWNICS
jgi:hypothetical protein